ncbi:tRNA(Phe) 7-((3-amino-3-carboxypropyl)-4-demethylwyosine(37)-N(4))-methyltransferase Taw3 [Methanocaldococcus sp. 10A]
MGFLDDKKRTLMNLELAIREGLVDEEIIPILNKINEIDNYYTTSSCIGRVGIMEIPKDKNPKIYSRWLGKWHHYATYDEMFDALKERKEGYLVFVMNSPILHIACKDIDSAKKMLELAIHSGLKASSIKSVSEKRVIVEILTTYKVDAPIGEDGKIFVDNNYLMFLLDYSNSKLKKAREILMRWANRLDELNK